MPYANPEDKRAHSRRYYAKRTDYYKAKCYAHRAENPKLHAYWGQRHTCKQRAIPFRMTFEEWVEWWGDDFERRGAGRNQLCMCRYADRGAYELGNIYKATNAENKAGPEYKDDGLHEDIPY